MVHKRHGGEDLRGRDCEKGLEKADLEVLRQSLAGIADVAGSAGRSTLCKPDNGKRGGFEHMLISPEEREYALDRLLVLRIEENYLFQTFETGENNVAGSEVAFVVPAIAVGILEAGSDVSFASHSQLQLLWIRTGEVNDGVDSKHKAFLFETAECIHVRERFQFGDWERHALADGGSLDVEHAAHLAHLRQIVVVLTDERRVCAVTPLQRSPWNCGALFIRHMDTDRMLVPDPIADVLVKVAVRTDHKVTIKKAIDMLAVGARNAAKDNDVFARKVVEDHVDQMRVGEHIDSRVLGAFLAIGTGLRTSGWRHGGRRVLDKDLQSRLGCRKGKRKGWRSLESWKLSERRKEGIGCGGRRR